jgi:hypothetical protein
MIGTKTGDKTMTRSKSLTPAADRALEEAAERRKAGTQSEPLPPEYNGRKGPEPTRYGDWETNGIASDF